MSVRREIVRVGKAFECLSIAYSEEIISNARLEFRLQDQKEIDHGCSVKSRFSQASTTGPEHMEIKTINIDPGL